VVCRGQRPVGADAVKLAAELREWVGKQLGAIAKPDDIRFTEVLPKTRSGKIMRRLLRALARGEEITQDTSTLENPAILAQLRGEEEPAAAKRSPKPKAKPKSKAKPRPKPKLKAKSKVKLKPRPKPKRKKPK
jgi:hypothetical protein